MAIARRPLPTKPALPVWKWLIPLILALLALLSLYRWMTRPVNPSLQAVAQSRTVQQNWQVLRSFGPRPVGSDGHQRARDWLAGQLEALGYRVTRQPVTLTRPFDLGGTLQAGGARYPVQALYGARGGEQTAKLLLIPPDADERLQQLDLVGNLVVTTCPTLPWKEIVSRVMYGQALGLVIIDDCPSHRLQAVGATPLPLVQISGQYKAQVLALVGKTVRLNSQVEDREVHGENLIARRVNTQPEVVFGAHLDSVNGTVGANDNASGVLAVLEAARRAAGTTLAEQSWFVLFDAEEDGVYGSRLFVQTYAYPLRQTRVMINFDMVGVNAPSLGLAVDSQLKSVALATKPDIRLFSDEGVNTRVSFGRTLNLTGRSDHLSFKRWGVRTAFLHRGEDVNYHSPNDQTLRSDLINEDVSFALDFARRVLDAPYDPPEPCGIIARDC